MKEALEISLPRNQALAEILGPREKAGVKMYKRYVLIDFLFILLWLRAYLSYRFQNPI